MKGVIITITRQKSNSLQWAGQDQNYLPRFTNYLKINFPNYTWTVLPGHELATTNLSNYDIVALPPVSLRFEASIKTSYPNLKIVKPSMSEFMSMLAPKNMVANRTTGYLIVAGPKILQKDLPKENLQKNFTNDNLRQLMRDYPKVIWEVVTFEELKTYLTNDSQAVTVALTPQTKLFEKFIKHAFPRAKVIQALPSDLVETPAWLERCMIATCLITMILLGFLVLFQ